MRTLDDKFRLAHGAKESGWAALESLDEDVIPTIIYFDDVDDLLSFCKDGQYLPLRFQDYGRKLTILVSSEPLPGDVKIECPDCHAVTVGCDCTHYDIDEAGHR